MQSSIYRILKYLTDIGSVFQNEYCKVMEIMFRDTTNRERLDSDSDYKHVRKHD